MPSIAGEVGVSIFSQGSDKSSQNLERATSLLELLMQAGMMHRGTHQACAYDPEIQIMRIVASLVAEEYKQVDIRSIVLMTAPMPAAIRSPCRVFELPAKFF